MLVKQNKVDQLNMDKHQLTRTLLVLCFAAIIKTSSCETFHIVTSSSSPCPGRQVGEPCLTLQQYVSNPSRSSSITLELEAGSHRLPDTSFEVSGIASFEIVSIANQAATVGCSSSSFLNINSVQAVHIGGVSFITCSTSVNNANTFTLEDSYILNSTISVRSVTQAVVRRASFSFDGQYGVSISETASASLENSTFYDIVSIGRPGGGIWGSNSNIRVTQCSFTNIIGTALYVERDRNTISIENSTFAANRINSKYFRAGGIVFVRSGSVTIAGSDFIDNSVSGNGGVLWGTAVDLSIHESNFINNTANGNGGALYIQSSTDTYSYSQPSLSSVSINDSNFVNNIANESGGALYVSGSLVSISRSAFTDNAALLGGGGAVYCKRHSTEISLVDNVFTNNSAAYCGVLAANEQYNYNVNFDNSIFSYNKAKGQTSGRNEGGVLCTRNASISFMNSSFSYNSAIGDAGVGYVEESSVVVQSSVFDSNSAGRDGGVFKNHVYPTTYTISQSSFRHNHAGVDGGVMYVGRAGSSVIVSESTFGFNSATERGGIATLLGSQLYFTETTLTNNTAYWGAVLSGCNSNVTISNAELFVGADPIQPLCSLYYDSNTTIPQEDIRRYVTTPDTETREIPATIATDGVPVPETTLSNLPIPIGYSTSGSLGTHTTPSMHSTNPEDVTSHSPLDATGQTNDDITTTHASADERDSNAKTSTSADQELYHALTIVSFIVSITLLILVAVLYVVLTCCRLKTKYSPESPNSSSN